MRPLRPPPRVTPPKPPLHLFERANKQPQQAGLYDMDRYDTANHNDYSKSEPVKLNFDDDVKEQMRILEDSLKSMLPPEKDDYPYSQNDSRKIEHDDMYGAQRYDKPIPSKIPSSNDDYYNKSDLRRYDYNGDYLNPQQPPRNEMFLQSNKVPAYNEDLYYKGAPRKNEYNDDKYNASRFEKPVVQSSPVKNGLMLGMDKHDEKALKQQRQVEYKRQLDNQKPPAERVDPRDIKHGPSSHGPSSYGHSSYGNSSNGHNANQNRSQPHISPRGDDRFSTAAHSSALVYPESSGYFGGGSGSGISAGYGAPGSSGSSYTAAVHSTVQQKSVEKGMVFGADQERDKALKRAKQEEYKRQLDQMSNYSKFKKADVNSYNEPLQVSSQNNNYRAADSGGRAPQSNAADYSRDRSDHAQQQRPHGNSCERHASAVVYPENTSGGAGSYAGRGDGAPHPAVQQKSVEKGMVFGADQERDKALKRAKQEEYRRQLDQLKKVDKEPLREPLREQPHREPAREPLQIVTSSHFQVPGQRGANQSDYHGAPSYESRDYRSGGFGGGGVAYGANVSSMRDDDADFQADDGFAQWQREQEEKKLLVLKKQQLLQQHPGNPANNSYLDDEGFSAAVGAGLGAGVGAHQPYQLAPRGGIDSTGSRYSAAPPPQAWSEPPQQQYNSNSQYSQPPHSNIHVSNSSGAINGNYNSSPTRNAPSPQRQKWDSANAANEDAKKQAALQQRAILDQQVAEVKARKAAEKKREADEDMRRIRQLEAEKEEAAALIREEKEKKRAQEQKDLQEKQSLAAKEALKRRGGRGEAANDSVSADSGVQQNNAQHSTPVKISHASATSASAVAGGYDDREKDYMRRQLAAETSAPPLSHPSHDELVEREMERMRREVESDYYGTSGAAAQRSTQPPYVYAQPPSQLPSAPAVLTKEQFFQQQRDRDRERDSAAASAYNSYDRLSSDAGNRLAEHSRQQQQQLELETPRDYSGRGAVGAGGVGSGGSTGSPTKSPNNQARNRFNSDIYGANPLLGVGARDPNQWVPSGKGVTDKQRAGVAQQKSDLEEQIRANAERKAAEKQRLKDEDRKLLEAEKKAVSDALKATEDKKQAAVSARLQQEQQHLQLQQNNAQNKQHSERREPTRDAHLDRDTRYQQSDDRRDMGQRETGQHRGVSNVPSQSDDRYSHIDSPLRDAMNREAFRASQRDDNHRGVGRQAEPVPSIDLYGPSPAVDSIDRFVSNYAGRHPAEDDRHRPQDSYKSNNHRDNVRDSRESYIGYNNNGSNNNGINEQRPNGLYRLNASDARARADSGSNSNYHGNNSGYSNIPSSTGRSHHHEDISMKSESRLVPLYPYSSSSLLSSLNPVGNSFEHSTATSVGGGNGGGNQQPNRTSGGGSSGAGPPRVQPLQRHGGGGRAEDMEKSMTSHSFMQYVGQRTPLIDKYAPTSSQQQSTTGIANNYNDSISAGRPQSRPQSNGRDNAYSQLQQEISQSNNMIERQQTKLVTSDGYVMKNEYDFNPYDDTEEGVPKNRILDSRYSTKNKVEDSTDYESELRTIQEHDYQQSNSNNNSINNNNYGKSNSGKKKWDTSSQSVAATLQNISRNNVNVMSDDVMLN